MITPAIKYTKFRRWLRRHGNTVLFILGIISILYGFYTQNGSSARIQIIEAKQVEIQEKENLRITYEAAKQNELRGLKEYLKGFNDGRISDKFEKLPSSFEDFKKEKQKNESDTNGN
jgi:hypothetical protein